MTSVTAAALVMDLAICTPFFRSFYGTTDAPRLQAVPSYTGSLRGRPESVGAAFTCMLLAPEKRCLPVSRS